MSLLIGTSGWSYDDWVGPFYEKKSRKFSNYSSVFNTAEINSTFYRYPSEGMIFGLIRTAPPGFIFTAKLPKLITHEKWLSLNLGVEEDTRRFLELMRPLAEKLGPILIQLRPKFNYFDHYENLQSYLEVIPRNFEWAVEFRHSSWLRNETFELLSKHNVAYTIVDEPLLPPEAHVTADFIYIRWHGHGTSLWYDYEYSEDELDAWIPKVKSVVKKAKRTYGYFNNHFRANAVKNAVEMLDMLGKASTEQKMVLEKIVDFRKKSGRLAGIRSLKSFTENKDSFSVSDHLTRFTDIGRLSRGERIVDEELEILDSSQNHIKATLRNYNIELDLLQRVIKHNCDDWRKGTDKKRLCKHMVKFFLSLPQSRAKGILSQVWNEKSLWAFEA